MKPFDEWYELSKSIGASISLNAETKDSLVFVQEELTIDANCFMVINIRDVYGGIVSSDIIPITFE